MKYFDEAREIWQRFVPKSGQADTIQGELLRAVEKLRDEACRNGNINWDADFERLRRFILDRLLDPRVYDVETISRTRTALECFEGGRDPDWEEELYDDLGDRVVEYFRHYGSLPHPRNSELGR